MKSEINMSFAPADDGGVTFRIDISQGSIAIPLDHDRALQTAASFLLNAGVTRAEFEDGRLWES